MSTAHQFPITEMPGQKATREQVSMFYTRYRFVRDYCTGRDVVEVACGGAQGLQYLADVARRATGVDIDLAALQLDVRAGVGRARFTCGRAEALPLTSASHDTLLLLDSIYWLRNVDAFLREASRVLRPAGTLIVSTVNTQWPEFNPSPYATRYLTPRELVETMERAGFRTRLYAAFPTSTPGFTAAVVAGIRRLASAVGFIPTSIRFKELLKRLFYGRLEELPAKLRDDMAAYESPVHLQSVTDAVSYKLVYAVGQRESS